MRTKLLKKIQTATSMDDSFNDLEMSVAGGMDRSFELSCPVMRTEDSWGIRARAWAWVSASPVGPVPTI